jgi:predicted DNA-binding ribbon-helix-helix protein
MKSSVVKHSVTIGGHKTSVSLEDKFWQGLQQIATERRLTPSMLLAEIDISRRGTNLSSEIRLFVLDYYRQRSGGLAVPSSASVSARGWAGR